jgi:hypothetical protein
MKRTKGIGPLLVISDEIAATSSGCPVVTSNSSYFLLFSFAESPAACCRELHPIDITRKVKRTAEGTLHPSLLKGEQRARSGVD